MRPLLFVLTLAALVLVAPLAQPLPGALAFSTYKTGTFTVQEPTLGVMPDGTILVQASTRVIGSTNGGVSWTQRYAAPVGTTLDPYIHVDRATGIALTSQLYGACQQLARSTDGSSWTPTAQCVPGDHQKLGSGPWHEPVPSVLSDSIFYTCFNHVGETACATSADGGLTWGPQTTVFPGVDPTADDGLGGVAGACGGLEGDPVSGPDGTIYLPREYCGRPYVGVSRDNGVTWSLYWVAEPARTLPIAYGANNPAVTVADDGTVFYAWTGNDWRHHVARSTDGGATWSADWSVSAAGGSTTFPLILAGNAGQVMTAWVGTPDTSAGPDLAPQTAKWYLYVASTTNGNAATPTWTVVQVTTDPVQIGCISRHGSNCAAAQNLLDFNDIAVMPDGRAVISYTDGCASCTTQGASSRADGYIAMQTGGPTIR